MSLKIAATLALVFLTGCATEIRDYAKAHKQNTAASYRAFLQAWPSGAFAPEATQRLHWIEAKSLHNLSAYHDLIQNHSDLAGSAVLLQRLALLEALAAIDADAARALLVKYPPPLPRRATFLDKYLHPVSTLDVKQLTLSKPATPDLDLDKHFQDTLRCLEDHKDVFTKIRELRKIGASWRIWQRIFSE